MLGLWWVLRRRVSLRVRIADLRAMLRFGLPTVPADASVYALQVADRFYLFGVYSQDAAGRYAIAIKLATVVFVAVRGFQYAWPPLAYSIESDEEAAGLYSLVTTYYALATGVVVCAVALLGRWMVRLLAAPAVLRRLPRAAVAGARLGAVRPVPGVRRHLRARARHLAQLPRGRRRPRCQRRPAARARARTAAPGWGSQARASRCAAPTWRCCSSCTCSRAASSRSASNGCVWRSWRRSSPASPSSGELLLPTHGLAGLALRVAWLALVPAALLLTRFFHPHERAQARGAGADAHRRVNAFRAGHGEIEAYAEDPSKTSDGRDSRRRRSLS